MPPLDEIDSKILEILKKDSRTPFTEIATTLGVSDSTIHVRLKKLKEDGILLGFTLNINENLIEKNIHGLATINITPGHLEKVVSQLIASNNIQSIYETHGENDLIALIKAPNLEGLREVILEIRRIEHISSTSLTTVLKTWK